MWVGLRQGAVWLLGETAMVRVCVTRTDRDQGAGCLEPGAWSLEITLSVCVTTAFTYIFAIPANNYYWQTEIWERGGAAWTFDMKSGQMGWKWLVEPQTDTPCQKRIVTPPSAVKVRSEQL